MPSCGSLAIHGMSTVDYGLAPINTSPGVGGGGKGGNICACLYSIGV